jgi:hypothetical protein
VSPLDEVFIVAPGEILGNDPGVRGSLGVIGFQLAVYLPKQCIAKGFHLIGPRGVARRAVNLAALDRAGEIIGHLQFM